jgi:hypothetical protein
MKVIKWALLLIIASCLVLIAIGLWLYYFKHQEFKQYKNLAVHYFKKDKEFSTVHIKEKIQTKKVPHKKNQVIFHNSEVYDAICDLPNTDYKPFDGFKNCRSCPSYLNTNSEDKFLLKYALFGPFSNKRKNEALVFMSGCQEPAIKEQTAILLEKQGSSWIRKAFFKAMDYSQKPVSMRNKSEEDFLVGLVEKREINKTIQIIRINSFFHKTHKAYDLLKIYFRDDLDCSSQIQGAFYPPRLINKQSLRIGIEVIASDFKTKNKQNCPKKSYPMPPGQYIFDYETSLNDSLSPIGNTKKVLTLFEESFRF